MPAPGFHERFSLIWLLSVPIRAICVPSPACKALARTLEMLGRQQIAGIPTAISELFKNANDAYADKVEVDYTWL